MQYLGGKSKLRKQIAGFIESVRGELNYLEPFVGGAWVLQEIGGRRTASDINKALITMYTALQDGWIPPEDVSEQLYREYRLNQDPDDPITAFIGFGCSFGGKWFGGYARQLGYNFAAGGRRALQKQLPLIRDVKFICCDYSDWSPVNMCIYCDPPYNNTTGYKDGFDSVLFWETMRKWSVRNIVIISEYNAPHDFNCVLEMPTKTIIRSSDGKPINAIERLFMYGGRK